ncbi:GNAT family N-acetyltransferase [Grimontia marina]|uniref:Acetyltransferase (GNAT) family protein n=1 Tax=Grimontia marina TaxID=646534 RepID=A0A128FF39_9GAMM|nr:GNAT family N-acetyltransferase [Grimontia marina]CZF85413.1 Acetyltransferase (GNAT) family protein [Grimontia marina]
MESFRVSNQLEHMNIDLIHQMISESYWAKGIPKATLEKALVHSLCFGVFDENNTQVAFARMITDRATFAYLGDVFVVEERQGEGIAKVLMDSIVAHPDLQGLRRTMLATRDAHGLYEKYGFTPIANPDSLMQIWHPDIYK